MIKKNKWKLIISSIIILFPVLFGIFADKILPEDIAVHWGIDGNADGFMNSSLVFIVLPLIMLTVHWICMILTMIFDNNADQNKKIMDISYWIIPIISLTSCGIMFTTALGYTANILVIVLILIGVSFIIIGNYLPKTTRNLTMGIKIKWTLSNDENWNATHRFAGKVYVAVGFLSLLAIPLPSAYFPVVMGVIILLCVILPCVYSYRFYKKQITDGKVTKEDYERSYGELVKNKKLTVIITVIIAVVLAIVLFVVMFTGKIETTLDDNSLTVKASMWEDLTLDYEDIDSVEYRENRVDGERIMGVGTAKLLVGSFKNDEFGLYTRYTYTGDDPCVIIKAKGRTIVIGSDDEQTTKEIYDRIVADISE